MSFDIAVANSQHESTVHDTKSHNYTFIYFVRQYFSLILDVNGKWR